MRRSGSTQKFFGHPLPQATLFDRNCVDVLLSMHTRTPAYHAQRLLGRRRRRLTGGTAASRMCLKSVVARRAATYGRHARCVGQIWSDVRSRPACFRPPGKGTRTSDTQGVEGQIFAYRGSCCRPWTSMQSRSNSRRCSNLWRWQRRIWLVRRFLGRLSSEAVFESVRCKVGNGHAPLHQSSLPAASKR